MQINKLPDGFKCNGEFLKAYEKAEAEVLPFIKKKSHAVSSTIPTIDYDDALQEGRSAVIVALAYADASRNEGRVGPYVWRVVKNAYCALVCGEFAKSKVPFVSDVDTNGRVIKRPIFPISLDSMLETENGERFPREIADQSLEPDEIVVHKKMRLEVGRFTMKMYNKLNGVDYQVFKCKIHPPSDFLDMMYMDGVNFVCRNEEGTLILDDNFDIGAEHIGRYLSINKNAVGWSLYKIRKLFLEMARRDKDFIGLFDDMVLDRGWPMIHLAKGESEDLNFKRNIFEKRCLDTRQIKPFEYSVGKKIGSDGLPHYSRMIKWYKWGAVITLKRGKEYYTVIAEGRFNPKTGAVFGMKMQDAQEHIPMKWYRNMAKELKDD